MNRSELHHRLCACLLLTLGLSASTASLAQRCTREYTPVCGQVAGNAAPQTFSNRCLLKAANATFLTEGECTPGKQHNAGHDLDTQHCQTQAGHQEHQALPACAPVGKSKILTLEVGPERRSCTGMIEMQCLMVRERLPGQAPGAWEPMLGDIQGFKHVPGKHYTLRVRKDILENPPADASNIRYTLLKLVK